MPVRGSGRSHFLPACLRPDHIRRWRGQLHRFDFPYQFVESFLGIPPSQSVSQQPIYQSVGTRFHAFAGFDSDMRVNLRPIR